MLIILSMIILFAIGVPIAYTLGAVGLLAILSVGSIKLEVIPLMVFNGAQSYTLIAIPLFILMGQIMNRSSISRRLIDFASSIVGFIKGGLGMATILAGMAMAAISGSSVADAAALGSVLIPQMDKRGYGRDFAASIISSAATIAQIIPPSITMILYAVIAGVSISELFIAGIIPGILVGLGLMIVIYWYAVKMKLPIIAKFSLEKLIQAFKYAFWGLMLPFIVIGGILGGFFTPTEAGAVGVFYALLLSMFIYKEFSLKDLVKALTGTAKQTAIVIIMVGTSALLGWYLGQQQIPQKIADAILNFSTNKYILLLLVNALILVGGMFLHGTPLVIMLVPMVVPLVQIVGVDLIQFGIITCISIAIGQITPPVASVLMTTCGIAEISMNKVLKSLVPMILVLVVVLLLVSFIPGLSLMLPNLLMN